MAEEVWYYISFMTRTSVSFYIPPAYQPSPREGSKTTTHRRSRSSRRRNPADSFEFASRGISPSSRRKAPSFGSEPSPSGGSNVTLPVWEPDYFITRQHPCQFIQDLEKRADREMSKIASWPAASKEPKVYRLLSWNIIPPLSGSQTLHENDLVQMFSREKVAGH